MMTASVSRLPIKKNLGMVPIKKRQSAPGYVSLSQHSSMTTVFLSTPADPSSFDYRIHLSRPTYISCLPSPDLSLPTTAVELPWQAPRIWPASPVAPVSPSPRNP
jgi:hypothetical protein